MSFSVLLFGRENAFEHSPRGGVVLAEVYESIATRSAVRARPRHTPLRTRRWPTRTSAR